ncbi:hypothetical protein KY285_022659 [Solanum tuberosum]|nr:hypothetical protein KY285_022659 [Solanum tuberosum]
MHTRIGYYRPMQIKIIVWPPALCDQKGSCCYPTTGKPTLDFGVHGLWPNYHNGSYPSICDNTNLYDETEIKDLISSMQENWPTLAYEHSKFKAALTIKEKVNLLSVLKDARIEPGGFYGLEVIKEAAKNGTGHEAAIECNKDALDLINCPILPQRKCNETIEFATFGPEAFVEEGSFFTLSLESDQSSTY